MARTKHGTITAEQVDVDLGVNYRFVEVLVRSGDADLWVVADPPGSGTIAAVDDSDVIPSGVGSLIVESTSQASTIVRLETTGTVAFSVKGLDG